jgi:NitT/TauT family transport system substrate-binding protein
MKRPRLLPLLAVLTVVACTNSAALAPARAAGPTYNVYMNWFPEPEEGGYYYADHMGLWQKYGVDAGIHEFSFAINSTIGQILLPGKGTFVMANADEVLRYRAKGAKIVAIMNTFQINPQGIIYHAEDTSIHSLADLSNHTLIYSFGAGYEPYLVLKYHYTNFKTQSYDFTSRAFALNPKAVNQCYVTSEPYVWGKQGLKVKYLLIAASGYSPYGDVIATTEDMVKNHPDQVRAFVKGAVEGWYAYLKDPKATNAYMLAAPGAKNYPQKPDEQMFSYNQVVKLGLIAGGDAATHGIGYFSLARWKTLQQQMVSVGQKVGNVDVTQAFTNQFLPGKM